MKSEKGGATQMDELMMKERRKKIRALVCLEKILAIDDRHFMFRLLGNEMVEVTDMISGNTCYVNIACDNVPAMVYDILKQAGDWIL